MLSLVTVALLMILPGQSSDAGTPKRVHQPTKDSRCLAHDKALGGLRFGSGGDLPFTPDNYPPGSKPRR
jgi:hypothetical protein